MSLIIDSGILPLWDPWNIALSKGMSAVIYFDLLFVYVTESRFITLSGYRMKHLKPHMGDILNFSLKIEVCWGFT